MSEKTIMLIEYPHLPLLSMKQCVSVFKLVNMGPAVLASMTGYTRMSAYRWLSGVSSEPNKATLERVSTLAYRSLRAIRKDNFKITSNRKVLQSELSRLRETSDDTPLSECTAQELLPKTWLDQFNLPSDNDVTATIL